MSTSLSSKTLAQFEIVRRLGAGGMAEVFVAKKKGAEGTYKLLVVKRILPKHGASRRFRTMFVEEAQLATRLNHPNVVQVYEFFDAGEEGQLLAMEYVEGCDLGRLMAAAREKNTRIAPWLGAWIVAEAAKGLHYAHEKKDDAGELLLVVHRDVSPQNVLLSFEGGVKIADFGIASARHFVEEQGVLKGKFGYMSPEQARGEKVDRRSDVFSLGVILWEILAGRPRHGGLGGEALLDMVREGYYESPAAHADGISEELLSIVEKALAPAAADRFASAREFSMEISRALVKRQELVDATVLEATLADLAPRAAMEPAADLAPEPPGAAELRTQAAVPMARGSSEVEGPHTKVPTGHEGDAFSGEVTPVPRRLLRTDGPREVRHVALVTLRLFGFSSKEGRDAKEKRIFEQLRAMLSELAYKRAMSWAWGGELEATALAGLGPNPARAAADAAWLALDTHETLAGYKEELPEIGASLGIVRGIASGTRDPEGRLITYSLHAPASQLAEELSIATPCMKTWVAGGIYRLVRREFRWGDAPTLVIPRRPELSELPSTMRIYSLERSLSREERVVEMAMLPSDLVGRDTEKADLHAAYHHAVGQTRGGRVTFRAIVGEMGIGKTALVQAFLAELPPNGRVIRAECSPVRQEIPYFLLSELVRDALRITGDEPPTDVMDRLKSLVHNLEAPLPLLTRLSELATGRKGSEDDEDAALQKKNLVLAARLLMTALAQHEPIVAVLEGLQWADKASLELLAELVSIERELPLLVLLVTRAEERVFSALPGVVRIALSGLSTEEQVRLVEARLGVREGVRHVCADLVPRVAGNPFFLLEMVDALLERGAIEIREAVGADGTSGLVLFRTERAEGDFQALPSTLEQLLSDRIRELPNEEHAIVDWLAIAGGPLRVTTLLELSRSLDDEAVVRLCARGLCDRKGETVDFRHPLTRDVAYHELGPADRTRLHRVLGEYLADARTQRGLSAAIVAKHLLRGDLPLRAAQFLLEAAQAARSAYQTPLAIRYFRRALTLLSANDPGRVLAHESLESLYRLLGRRRERMKELSALRYHARAGGSPERVCLALLRTARFLFDDGKLVRGAGVARRAAEVSRRAKLFSLEAEAEGLVGEFLRELGDVQGALSACDRALSACDPKVHRKANPRARAEILRTRGVLLRRVGRVDEAIHAYADAIAVFRRLGARRQEARAKNSLAYAMFVQGHYEDTISLALESIRIDLSIGGRFQVAKTLCNIANAYFRAGDVPRALAYLRRSREAHDRYEDQDGRADTLLVSAELALELDDLSTAEAFIRDAGALIAVTNNAYDKAHEAVLRAALCRARSQMRDALVFAADARALAEPQALVSYHFYGMALEAEARVLLGEPHAGTLLATTALGAVQTLQGCEYGLEIRILCARALELAGSPQTEDASVRAVDYAVKLMKNIRDPRMRRLFLQRPPVARLFSAFSRPKATHEGA